MIYYAGIGSRETPEAILNAFEKLGEKLGEMGFILRSGRAPGADSYFEMGANKIGAETEIYIPWKNFPKDSPLAKNPAIALETLDIKQQLKAVESVNRYHPAPERLSQGAMKLMARNYCQLYGRAIDAPISSFIVCYTKDGKASGGTGQAIRMANDMNIPVLNAHGFEKNPEAFIDKVTTFAKKYIDKEYDCDDIER